MDRLRWGSGTTIGMLCLRSNTFTESILPALAGLAKGVHTGHWTMNLLQKIRLADDERVNELLQGEEAAVGVTELGAHTARDWRLRALALTLLHAPRGLT